jgi:undecaprenyl-diphosphatase
MEPAARRDMHPIISLVRWLDGHFRSMRAAIGALLVAGLIVSAGSLFVFAGVALLMAAGATQRMDESILLWMYGHSTPVLDSWALKLTSLGSSAPALMIALTASAFLWIGRHRWTLAVLWTAVLGSAVLSTTLKAAFDRPRPMLWDRMHAGEASFPSGHAMSAVVIYGTLAYLVARLESGRGLRILTYGIAATAIVIIGVTRMYLGVHYPSDVIAGYAVALGWASFCALSIEVINQLRARRRAEGIDERGEPLPPREESRSAPTGARRIGLEE